MASYDIVIHVKNTHRRKHRTQHTLINTTISFMSNKENGNTQYKRQAQMHTSEHPIGESQQGTLHYHPNLVNNTNTQQIQDTSGLSP